MNKKLILFSIFSVLIFLGIFLRFYNLRSNIQFDYDQENSLAFPAKSILIDRHLTLIGPKTGVGDLYLGPLYYYLVAIFYGIFHMDPIAGVLLGGTLTILFILLSFILIKKIFNLNIAYIYTLTYASSSFLVDKDRTPWNPNLFPLSSILVFFGLWMALYNNKKYGWIAIALGLIIGMNSHFSVIFLLAVVLILSVLNKSIINKFSGFAFMLIFLSLFPLIIFNFKHDQLLTNNLLNFVYKSMITSGNNHINILSLTLYLMETIGRVLVTDVPSVVTQSAGIVYILTLIYYHKDPLISKFNKIFIIYLVVYILGFTIYNGSIPNYYFMGFIIVALIGYSLIIGKVIQKFPLILLLLFLQVSSNSIRSFYEVSRHLPGSLADKQSIVKAIKKLSQNQPISIDYNMNTGWSYGYKYLFYYYQINIVENKLSKEKFMISFPQSQLKVKSDYVFGDIALTQE